MKVSWTPTARKTYFKILDYLEISWTEKELQNFIDEVDQVIKHIAKDPHMYEASRKKKNVRKGFITKHNTLYYRIKPRKKELELITFWDNRQDPKRLAYWED
jgi:plasmid stabilization system protein ParE